MRYLAVLGLILIAAAPLFAQPRAVIGSSAPDFSLKDQFDKNWSTSGLKGSVTILVIADTDSGRAMGPWVDGLKAKYAGKATILGLLDLHSVPGIGRGIAKSRIKKETQDPQMLDFSGNVASAYGVSSKYPVVVVIDKAAIIRAAARTAYSADAFGSISKAVDAALAGK